MYTALCFYERSTFDEAAALILALCMILDNKSDVQMKNSPLWQMNFVLCSRAYVREAIWHEIHLLWFWQITCQKLVV